MIHPRPINGFVYARHGHELMGCKSPVGDSALSIETMITTSRRQGHHREVLYWKQWRRVRTKVRHLLALGTSKRQAVLTALSRKAYWHLARTLTTQTGMTNHWLESQGLLSIRTLWMKAHGYA